MDKVVRIAVSVADQQLIAYSAQGKALLSYSVSTAKKGIGQQQGSECTPLGKHIIRAKIGDKLPENTVFIARRPSGEIYTEKLAALQPDRDWILTRILWLSGCEPGYNRLGNVDTMRRFIYIHGAPDSHPMGVPSSHGCIKMRNQDIIALYDKVVVDTEVIIQD